MTDEDALLRAVIADPDDDAPRLIFADWLDENGQCERAEFIRVQIALAQLPSDDPARSELVDRERQLLSLEWKWAAPIVGIVSSWQFIRGFIELVVCEATTFLNCGEGLFRQVPLRRVNLRGAKRVMPRLIQCSALARLPMLDLSRNSLRDGGVQQLTRCPHLKSLRLLNLSCNNIGIAGARALVQAPYLTSLEKLALGGNPRITNEAAFHLRSRFGRQVVHF